MAITDLIKAGALNFVRGYAIESVRGFKGQGDPPARSPLSRAVAAIRRDFSDAGNPVSYEDARNVFRRAQRQVRAADRETRRQDGLLASGLAPEQWNRNRLTESRTKEYGVFVRLVSDRTGKEYRGTVLVEAKEGTPIAALATIAKQNVIDRSVGSRSTYRGRNYSLDVRNNWQIEQYELLWVNDA